MVRPHSGITEYWFRGDQFQNGHHEVTAVISGWAQVKGRSGVGWLQKFKYEFLCV